LVGSAGEGTGEGGGESDPLYDQAVEIVIKNRRAVIADPQMEQSGLVSAMSSSGNREILVPARDAE
ncbi:hypothetical protein, partial [Burkholderia pseudomallei]|uniref:hypothetical protein n=1 Tax=Burkholderia pseudomallei TaxID=28450 RepID=UPI0021F7E7C5